MTDVNPDEFRKYREFIVDQFIDSILEGLTYDDLVEIAYEWYAERYEMYSDKVMIEEISVYNPELLDGL